MRYTSWAVLGAVGAFAVGIWAGQIPTGRSGPEVTMKTVLADFDRYLTAVDPIRAEQRGDLSALRLWPDDSPKAIATYKEVLRGIQARLATLAGAPLPDEDVLNRDLLRERVDLDLEGYASDEQRVPFNAGDGFFTVPNDAADGVVLRSEEEARAWLEKLAALPVYYTTEIENMRRGLATGFVRPRLIVERVIAALKVRVSQPVEANSLLRPLQTLPKTMTKALQAKLQAEAQDIVAARVKPEERTLVNFFEQEYLPRAARTLGITDVPDGKAYYAYLVRRMTSTDMSPETIHGLGLAEVARIRQEMEQLIARVGFQGKFAEFLAFLRTDKQFQAASVDDYLMRTRDIAKRVDALLPGYFRTLPRLTYGVRLVPLEMRGSSSGYNPGSPEEGVPGMVLVNIKALDQSPLYELPAWFLHEGVPGHHLQIALAQERFDLPNFRRIDDINAFVEGWALYSEHLGVEMGVYRTPYEDFGRLSLEMWRACRLVVDTGLHVMQWTRSRAIDYIHNNTALSQATIEAEVDRYIGGPGQALGYKIGEIRIRQLRSRAEASVGPKFDLRAFHDAILLQGPMPLDILERQIDRWIKSQR